MASPGFHRFDEEGDVILGLNITSTVNSISKAAATPSSVEESNRKGSSKNVTALVSSKQLSAASAVFKDMLSYRFSEGDDLKSTGSVQIDLPEDNGDAWLILLAAIHGKMNLVPTVVDLGKLFEIASLIDKYNMKGFPKGSLKECIRNIRRKRPDTSKRLVQGAYIFYVFDWPNSFAAFTMNILFESDGSTKELGLLVPDQILVTIERKRQEILASLFEVINAKFRELLNSEAKRVCGDGLEACDSRTLGSVQITLWSAGVVLPALSPFKGIIIKRVVEKLSDYNMPDCWHRRPWECERFDRLVRDTVKGLKPKLEGIELSEFKR